MTTLREAAKQALTILEAWKHKGMWGDWDGVTDALKAALAEPVEPDPWGAGYEAGYEAGVARRPAQPVQDHFPDATKMVQDADLWSAGYAAGYAAGMEECPAEPVQEPVEPVAGRAFLERILAAMEGVIDVADRKTDEFDALRSCVIDLTLMLHTAPPQRPAEPLTEEEIRDLWSWAMTAEAERTATTQQHAFARAIERAHGITS